MNINNKLEKNKKIDIYVYVFLLIIPYIFYFNLFQNDGIWGAGDAQIQYIPFYKALRDTIRSGNFSGWIDGICLGVPFFESIVASIFYPLNWLFVIFDIQFIYNKFILLHFSIAGIFTYKYIKKMGYSWNIALLGGIVYMFSGALNCRKNHVNILHTIVWFPAIIYYYEKMYSDFRFRNRVLFAISLTIVVYCGALQHYLYIAITLFVYFLFKLYISKNKKEWIIKNIMSIGFSILLSLPIIIFMLDTLSGSAKDVVDYFNFASYSLPFKNLLTFIFPYIFGTHIVNEPYSIYANPYIGGGNLSEFGLYVGSITVIGALYISYRKFKENHIVKIWTTIMFISIILSIGGYIPILHRIMFIIPGYNLFRVPARWLFITDFAIVILFCEFLNSYFNVKLEKIKFRKIYYKIYFFTFYNIIFLTILNSRNIISMEIMQRITIFNSEICIPFILMTLYYFYIIFAEYNDKIRGLINTNNMILILATILIIDVWTFGFFHENILIEPDANNYLAEKIAEINEKDSRVWAIIDEDEYFFDGLGVNYNLYNNVRSINGYWGMSPKEQNLLLNFDSRGNNIYPHLLLNNPKLLGNLDTEFVAINKKNEQLLKTLKAAQESEEIFNEKSIILEKEQQTASIYTNIISVKPNTNYKIIFELNPNNEEEGTVIVDLYGNNYDKGSQEGAFRVDGNSKKIEFVINTGEFLETEPISIRAFTLDEAKISIENLQVIEMIDENYRYEIAYEDEKYIVFKIPDKYLSGKLSLDNDLNILNEDTEIEHSIEILEYRAGYLRANVISKETTNLIFNESYNKGWQVKIDGESADIKPVNGLIQGVSIQKGTHEVVFKYSPQHLRLNIYIYLISLIYIYGCYVFYKKSKDMKEED